MEEKTFIAVKPDGVQRGLIGKIIDRFEQRGYKLVAIKLLNASRAQLEQHYAELQGKPFFNGLITYMMSGPICAMVWQGKGVVETGRRILGKTNPLDSAPGTVRGDFAIDVGRNVCHGSDSITSAQKEISLWFNYDEILNWNSHCHNLELNSNKFFMEKPSFEVAIAALIDRFSVVKFIADASAADRAIALSLYYLFKNTFLLALDLLDKGHIVKCTWDHASNQQRIYYVFEAVENSNTINIPSDTQKHQYEVRMFAWHCSCSEFAFSAFNNDYHIIWNQAATVLNGFWGGCILGHPIPVCKHLLACVLVERATWMRQYIAERQISKKEFVLRTIQ
ncbi:hypothetical protein PCANB_003027 [Pneumocystis canis]|nr:hypothetical protein PCK1_003106 [Pneumocystis canis]KAG5438176.1 hypothetical protein PCANB_003027 [Pneumocystis canis]